MEFQAGEVDLYVADGTISPNSPIKVFVFEKKATLRFDVESEFVSFPHFYRNSAEEIQLGLFIKLPRHLAPDSRKTYYALAFQQPEKTIVYQTAVVDLGVAGH